MLLILLFLFGSTSRAADLDAIFPKDTQTSPAAQRLVAHWLSTNCKDLNWALEVVEVPSLHEACGAGIEKIHVRIALSHLVGETIFWVQQAPKVEAELAWFYEEFPSWHICSYAGSYYRDDKSCRFQAIPGSELQYILVPSFRSARRPFV